MFLKSGVKKEGGMGERGRLKGRAECERMWIMVWVCSARPAGGGATGLSKMDKLATGLREGGVAH